MKGLFIILAIITVGFGAVLKKPNGIYEDGDRFFYIPGDGDVASHLVDALEPVDDIALSEIDRSGSYRYWLFTRENPSQPYALKNGDEASITNSAFKNYKNVIFLAHGWLGHGVNEMNRMLTDAFLQDNDVNIIVVDWSAVATRNYVTAKRGVAVIGERLGEFINWLTTLGVSYDQVHLVGFSLGAHLVGNAGRKSGGLVKRITGLDPAGPLWKSDRNRLRPSDGQYVEVIHTNTATYGYAEPCGHADFYPNGGSKMPGCWLALCSHRKAYEYMAATVVYNHLIAKECSDIRSASKDKCSGPSYPMGNSDLSKSTTGIFRVNTDEIFPF